MKKIRVIGPKDKNTYSNENQTVINVTSSSKIWTKCFSPFILGPVTVYNGIISKNVENAWQYSKVYEEHIDEYGNPNSDYFKWANKGWNTFKGIRYPFGKNKYPKYSYWNGNKLDYIQARKDIYIPLYKKAVIDSGYLKDLIQLIKNEWKAGKEVILWDYDGYDYLSINYTLEDVLNDKSRKMGHAFVLVMLIEDYFKESNK